MRVLSLNAACPFPLFHVRLSRRAGVCVRHSKGLWIQAWALFSHGM